MTLTTLKGRALLPILMAVFAMGSLAAQDPAEQGAPVQGSPYQAAQPTAPIPQRPAVLPSVASPEAQLAQEERNNRYLMDLQIANQARQVQSQETVRRLQEQAAAAQLEYYTRLLEPAGAAPGTYQPGQFAIPGVNPYASNPAATQALANLQASIGPASGYQPNGLPVAQTTLPGAPQAPRMSGGPVDAAAGEDGPTLARKKGLGFLPKGSIVDIRLLTRVNTSIPGPVLGEVVFDVWDVDQRYILIPRGSKAIGVSGQMGSDTDSGGKVVFDTFVDPSGREIAIATPAVSASRVGVTGIPGNTDYHWGRVFGGSAALAIITGISGGGSQPAASNINATQSDLMRQSLIQQGGSLSTNLLNRFIQTKPDVTLVEGTTSKVILLEHMLIRPYQKVF